MLLLCIRYVVIVSRLELGLINFVCGKTTKWLVSNDGNEGGGKYYITSKVANRNLEI